MDVFLKHVFISGIGAMLLSNIEPVLSFLIILRFSFKAEKKVLEVNILQCDTQENNNLRMTNNYPWAFESHPSWVVSNSSSVEVNGQARRS
jgi:hypothetical protein